jgi:hypothetical protein
MYLKRQRSQAAAQFRSVDAFLRAAAGWRFVSVGGARGISSQANTQKLIIWHLTKCTPRQYIGREIFLGGSVWWKSERITPSVIDRLVRKSTAAALWNFAKQLSFSLFLSRRHSLFGCGRREWVKIPSTNTFFKGYLLVLMDWYVAFFSRFFRVSLQREWMHHVICERARVFLIRPHATFGSNYLANNVGEKLNLDQYSENNFGFLENESTATQVAAE